MREDTTERGGKVNCEDEKQAAEKGESPFEID
jgi:hypothetical protein